MDVNNKSWAMLLAKSRQNPAFLGYPLTQYAQANGWDDSQLAAAVGCPVERFLHLMLCKRPAWHDAENIRKIAEYVRCNADKLKRILMEIES